MASHVARAAKAAGPDKKAAAKAADGAFNAHLDRVLLIGWANVESFCLDNFIKVSPENGLEWGGCTLRSVPGHLLCW